MEVARGQDIRRGKSGMKAEGWTVQIHSHFCPVFAVDQGPGPPRPGRLGPSKDAAPGFRHSQYKVYHTCLSTEGAGIGSGWYCVGLLPLIKNDKEYSFHVGMLLYHETLLQKL